VKPEPSSAWDYALHESWASWAYNPWGTDDGSCDWGHIKTPLGVVVAYAHETHDGGGYTRLECSIGGREYDVTWEKRYSRRFMVTLANRWMEELCG
jgi:hypothetical protein